MTLVCRGPVHGVRSEGLIRARLQIRLPNRGYPFESDGKRSDTKPGRSGAANGPRPQTRTLLGLRLGFVQPVVAVNVQHSDPTRILATIELHDRVGDVRSRHQHGKAVRCQSVYPDTKWRELVRHPDGEHVQRGFARGIGARAPFGVCDMPTGTGNIDNTWARHTTRTIDPTPVCHRLCQPRRGCDVHDEHLVESLRYLMAID